MKPSVIVRLCIMMFLQYFVWGIWLPILGVKLEGFKLSDGTSAITPFQIGMIGTVYGFGSILGPFILGQIADRYVAAERVMGIAHILGGLILLAASTQTEFWPIFLLLFLYCNLYMPTMGLTNSITFRTLGEAEQNKFPLIRNLGTIGWIAAGWFYTYYQKWLSPQLVLDCLRVAGIVSIGYGIFSFFLPHTPPVPAKSTDPVDKRSAVLESLELMRNRSFAILITVAGLIGIMLAFYFQCEGFFLKERVGIPEDEIGFYMSFGQIAEMIVMLFVPITVAKLGVKKTMILGAGAWALRFGLSILGQPQWLMISTITLHGFCFGFFFVVAQMFVDRAASNDIKSSAQNLLIFVVYGLGTVVGNLLGGKVREIFGTNWAAIWAGPFVLTVLCIVAFALLFKDEEIRKPAAEPEAALA